MDIGGLFWGWWKYSGIRCQWWLPNFVNILKINELCTLQGSVCVIWIISQFLKIENHSQNQFDCLSFHPWHAPWYCSLFHSSVRMVLLIFKDSLFFSWRDMVLIRKRCLALWGISQSWALPNWWWYHVEAVFVVCYLMALFCHLLKRIAVPLVAKWDRKFLCDGMCTSKILTSGFLGSMSCHGCLS